MKIKAITILSILAFITIYQAANNKAYTYPEGAPSAKTGAPGEGKCSDCHSGGASGSVVDITTDIDSTGYIPGQTYTITATVSNPSCNKFGFQISAKPSSGSNRGTLKVTNSNQTRIVSTNYITHTTSGNVGSNNSKTWTFQWVAPQSGTGKITFYGSFLSANADGNTSGDATTLKNIAVQEDATAGIGVVSNGIAAGKVAIYPNPVHETLSYTVLLAHADNVNSWLTDINGRTVKVLHNGNLNAGINSLQTNVADLPLGLYLLNINTSKEHYVQKVVFD